MLRDRLMPSDEYVSVSGEGGVLNEEADLWKVGRDGKRKREKGVGESTDLSLEEMTELTPQACHILFSASLSKTGLRTKKGASAVTCSWLTHQA